MLPTILCFLAPLTLAVELELAGGVFLAELVTPCVAIAFVFRRRISGADTAMFLVAQLGLVYLAALIVSDLWNGSSFDQFSRGWARLGVFLVNLASIYILIDNRRKRLIAFTLGLVAGRILLSVVSLDDNLLSWKLGFSKPTVLFAALFCVALYKYGGSGVWLSSTVLIGLGFYNLLMDFRSLAVVLIATTIVLITSDLSNKAGAGVRQRRSRMRSFAAIVLCGLIATGVTYQAYVYAAKSDWLNERATNKFETQISNTDLPLLVAGRSELLVSIEAILDAPFLGHGSWPENRYYADKIALSRYQYHLSNSVAAPQSNLIPMHSHLFGGWIEAGLAGGIFWSVVLFLVGVTLTRTFHGRSPMRPLYVYCSILLIWDVLFSPFSGFRRIETAYLIVVTARGLLQRVQGQHIRRRRSRARSRHRRVRPAIAGSPANPYASGEGRLF